MKTTDLHIGDWVHFKVGLHEDKLSIPMMVVGIFSSFSGISPKDTVYLDFEGNEGDVWEEEVQNLVPCKTFDEILEANKDVLERIKEKGD
ncbi:hypothetical protein K0F45_08665 [Bacteroides ovatus]|jgi:hypothetical protein|uniref:hypothetical protein n=1 Tax=Bacteroides ovatus TaxID=28116 RepID=UPI001F27018B|nr:hypothetical protein [Bacteroides ovatus]MCE8977186.1 hypothetical protein [Bacteroides ovatus]